MTKKKRCELRTPKGVLFYTIAGCTADVRVRGDYMIAAAR